MRTSKHLISEVTQKPTEMKLPAASPSVPTDSIDNGGDFVEMLGVRARIPPRGDAFFKRVLHQHIMPVPPFRKRTGPVPVPLLVLCIPFTIEDQLRYADKHNLAIGQPDNQYVRCLAALEHLRRRVLPRQFSRWATVDDSNRCVVIATNESAADLELAFNLDMIESTRRLMGVQWIPTKDTTKTSPVLPDPELVAWPAGLPRVPNLTWNTLRQFADHEWVRVWKLVDVRLEIYARAKGGQVPPREVPMCLAFKLDLDGQD
ncbi:hypothetical protein BKA70DRAFT_1259110 [Coprinopsis sp. MPI-PUGE-AT-0042]|nr:hypothetical protein BKA70DRAFT_1259110 [Coprinopsis sp. MPI-PUGE-AT-0042]